MMYQISKPSPPLSRFIKHYWTMENCIPDGKEHIQRIVPSGLLELIFYLGDKPVTTKRDKSIHEPSVISGQLNEFYDLKITGKISLFSIIFKPHGLSVFLDMPLLEFCNQNVPLRFIFKDDTARLENQLFENKTFSERIQIIENYFLDLLEKRGLNHHFKRINESMDAIDQSKGLVDIDRLASGACFSRKQFERTFSRYIGTSPKQFLKIVRFQHAIDQKSRNKSLNLTDLTYQCGYYDQAHMIHDFQQLSGMTPKQFFNDCEPYSDYFQ